jgi:hypothetical protein
MSDDQLFTTEELSAMHPQPSVPEPDLPPAGYKRDDELARRQDTLNQQLDSMPDDIGTINPEALKPDHDLQGMIRKNFLEVNLGPAYKIKWVNFVSQHGQAVWQAKAEGWEVVTANMVNMCDRDLVKEDNTLRVGDVICMRIRLDRHLMLEQQAENRRLAQQFGIENEINEIASKHPKALKVHSDLSGTNPYSDQMQKRAARKTALAHIGNQMKKGPVAGIPIK